MSPVRTGHTFFSQVNTSMSHFKIRLLSAYFACFAVYISFANCKCKLDTCTVELSESERRSGWKPLASVLGDAAAAFGCVNRVEELVKQFLRGAVAKLLARPSVQFISCSQDILSRESLNGHALRNEGSKQPVMTFVLGTFPRGVGMRKVDCTASVLDLGEAGELRALSTVMVLKTCENLSPNSSLSDCMAFRTESASLPGIRMAI